MGTSIFFFGGFLAKITHMMSWQGSAASQTSDDTYVYTYAWPAGGGADDKSAIAAFRKAGTFDKALAAIAAASADKVFIVGHSSGCAIANQVDRELGGHDNVNLVALDGFAPDGDQLARPGTQVWSAVNGRAKAKNHDRLKDALGGRLKIYTATSCTSRWALHFSLVNAAATDAIDGDTWPTLGYANCRANLCWL